MPATQKPRRKVFQSLLIGIFGFYMISCSISAVYFNWQYARTHGFVAWLFLGEIASTAKALVWPYFVFTGERSKAENLTASGETPLNNAELQRLATALTGLTEVGQFNDQDISQVQSVLRDYYNRTGVKLTHRQYQEILGFLPVITEYKFELGRSALQSWDNGRVIMTPQFVTLRDALKGSIPEAQLREDSNMIEAASRQQLYIDASDGKRYEFSREGLVRGYEKKKRQRASIERLEAAVADLLSQPAS